ncbi:MAG: hypothetical protein NT151_11820 [Acidobacteria bacterium]|nr:hypothetical protein [Acidobacteriota bacterium]
MEPAKTQTIEITGGAHGKPVHTQTFTLPVPVGGEGFRGLLTTGCQEFGATGTLLLGRCGNVDFDEEPATDLLPRCRRGVLTVATSNGKFITTPIVLDHEALAVIGLEAPSEPQAAAPPAAIAVTFTYTPAPGAPGCGVLHLRVGNVLGFDITLPLNPTALEQAGLLKR